MRRREFPAGEIFHGLTDDELQRQAAHLLNKLSKVDIDTIIAASGMTGDNAEVIRAGLYGRRDVLREYFNIRQLSKERIPIAMKKLHEQAERMRGVELRPRIGFLADSDKIENQQVDVIDVADEGRIELNFKLTRSHYDRIRYKLHQMYELRQVERGAISYGGINEQQPFHVTDAWEVSRDGVTLRLAQGSGTNGIGRRSALGLVTIEVQNQVLSQEEIAQKIDDLVIEILEIPEGLTPPETTAETNYMWARYTWHHKLDPNQLRLPDILARLRREEVFPGYFTMVDPGKHKEYGAISSYGIYHSIQNYQMIPKIIKAGGILSTHERYRRGLLVDGMSSEEDMDSGGADSVFTRIVTEQTDDVNEEGIAQVSFIFEPSLLDRTDWYAYKTDMYGSTVPTSFEGRQAPKEIFESPRQYSSNEQMFRLGISMDDVRAIACQTPPWRNTVKKYLRESDIADVDVLASGTADDIRKRCAESGIRFVGGLTISDFVRSQQFEHQSRILEVIRREARWSVSTWWQQVARVAPQYETCEEFLQQDLSALQVIFEFAGVDPHDIHRDWNGGWNALIEQSDQKIVGYICDELKRYEMETVGKIPVLKLRDAKLSHVLSLLSKNGLKRLWGISLDDYLKDKSDVRSIIVSTLRAEGITEINGKPIEEFVVEARTFGDFIDISQGAPLRSAQQGYNEEGGNDSGTYL